MVGDNLDRWRRVDGVAVAVADGFVLGTPSQPVLVILVELARLTQLVGARPERVDWCQSRPQTQSPDQQQPADGSRRNLPKMDQFN